MKSSRDKGDMNAFREGADWQANEIDALAELIPVEDVYDFTTDEALAILMERGGMSAAQAEEALSLLRFGHRITDGPSLRNVEDEILTPAELGALPDDELVALIMERAGMDESRAREALAIIRGGPPDGVTY